MSVVHLAYIIFFFWGGGGGEEGICGGARGVGRSFLSDEVVKARENSFESPVPRGRFLAEIFKVGNQH